MAAEETLGLGIPAGGTLVDLLTDGVAVLDGFISPERVRGLMRCARLRGERGEFAAARVGADQRLQERTEIRGDSTCWLDEPCCDAERTLLAEFEQLRLAVNHRTYWGLFDLELHYALYPPGAGYLRHADQLLGRNQRKLTVILYLNEAWKAGYGGELRIFEAAGYRDIAPIAGRLVCFTTAGREHAVLATQRDRLSLSGWFCARS